MGRTPNSAEVFAFAPGIDASSVEVTIERNVLKISGSRTSSLPDRDAKAQLYANERPDGGFSRAVSLLDDADPLKVEAKYRDGNLSIEGRVELDAPAEMPTAWAEVSVPRFQRTLTLSRELDAARIEANLKDSVLTLRVPKQAHAQPRRIEVAVG